MPLQNGASLVDYRSRKASGDARAYLADPRGRHLRDEPMTALTRLSARTVLFVDRLFFDIREPRYKETLKACLDLLAAAGGHNVRCEIHGYDHPSKPPARLRI